MTTLASEFVNVSPVRSIVRFAGLGSDRPSRYEGCHRTGECHGIGRRIAVDLSRVGDFAIDERSLYLTGDLFLRD